MIITLENSRRLLSTEALIQLSFVYGSNVKNRPIWKLIKPLTIELSNGQLITIPEGFKTDLSSVPRWAWSVAAPYGDFLLAALIHDFLYVFNIGTRKAADKEMLVWSEAINGNSLDNVVRYYAVRLFGQSWWNS